MPRWIAYTAIVLAVLALVPLALIARARAVPSSRPRVHLIFDMAVQPKFKPQAANPLFADERAMRPPVEGTVEYGSEPSDSAVSTGRGPDGEWLMWFPVPVTEELMARGRERFEVFCSPCHGLAGYGDGMVAKRAARLQEGTWTPPSSFHTDLVRGRPVGHIFNTITNGIRNMPAYGPQIGVRDRWAIVAYVRALQLSQHATVDQVPADVRARLR